MLWLRKFTVDGEHEAVPYKALEPYARNRLRCDLVDDFPRIGRRSRVKDQCVSGAPLSGDK